MGPLTDNLNGDERERIFLTSVCVVWYVFLLARLERCGTNVRQFFELEKRFWLLLNDRLKSVVMWLINERTFRVPYVI